MPACSNSRKVRGLNGSQVAKPQEAAHGRELSITDASWQRSWPEMIYCIRLLSVRLSWQVPPRLMTARCSPKLNKRDQVFGVGSSDHLLSHTKRIRDYTIQVEPQVAVGCNSSIYTYSIGREQVFPYLNTKCYTLSAHACGRTKNNTELMTNRTSLVSALANPKRDTMKFDEYERIDPDQPAELSIQMPSKSGAALKPSCCIITGKLWSKIQSVPLFNHRTRDCDVCGRILALIIQDRWPF